MAENTTERHIIIISDGTGETASQMIKAAMVQFSSHDVYFTRHKNVRKEAQIEAICEVAEENKDLIVFTIVNHELRQHIISICRKKAIPHIDILGPLLGGLGLYFGVEQKGVSGLLHEVDEKYFKRIAAMEFTVAHDDGKDLTELDKADLVILGISRTSKTPLSMYLSHQGWKVANIPMIKGFGIPDELYKIDQRRIVCLTIDPVELATIRRNRLQRLGQESGGDYADLEKVNLEIEYANEIFKKNRKWPVINVTGKALEETAAEIMKLMASRRLTPPDSLEIMPPIKPPKQES